MSNEKQIMKVDELEKQIAQFTTIEEMKEGKDKMETMKVYMKKKKVERSCVQRLNAGAVRLAWSIGGVLKKLIGVGRPAKDSDQVKLADLGIEKNESSRYQIINNLPKKFLEDELTSLISEDRDITEKHFVKLSRAIEAQEIDINEEIQGEGEEDTGTARLEKEQELRDDFLKIITAEQILEIRKKGIKEFERLTDLEIDLMARAIIEVGVQSGKMRKFVEKFNDENFLNIENYWKGLSLIIRQMKEVYKSLDKNTTPDTPKAFLYFIQNIKQMSDLIDTWREKKLDSCTKCEGKSFIIMDSGEKKPCNYCLNGKAGWFKQ